MSTALSITSPVDDRPRVVASLLTDNEALARLEQAEFAFREFRTTTVEERVELMRRVLDAFDRHAQEFATEVAWAMGKPLKQALGEIAGMRQRAEAMCEWAPRTLADEPLAEQSGLRRFIRREPLGVVLDIAAWNYPYVVAINVVAPAILAGNAVLLKHAPQTAQVGRQFETCFLEAGAPEGLLVDFMASHETVAKVLATRRIAHVGFTGSVRGGHEVYQAVARAGFAGCGLEMGGKDAAIVLDDVDVESTAIALADGAFYNAGQSCCAVERIYVPAALESSFVEAFVAETHRLRLGHPTAEGTTLGPVVSAQAARRIVDQVEQARSQGARLASNDGGFTTGLLGQCYVPPRVLTGVTHAMDLMVEESFGPVIGIQTYKTEEEALHLANDSRFGLTGSVWSKDPERAQPLLDALEVGTVYLNRCDAVDPELPWVGAKESGLGCTLSHWGIASLTRPKSFNLRIG